MPRKPEKQAKKKASRLTGLLEMARPEGFEPPTTKFVAWYSIQLSYGRETANYGEVVRHRQPLFCIANEPMLIVNEPLAFPIRRRQNFAPDLFPSSSAG
jgi:hypothetical protein